MSIRTLAASLAVLAFGVAAVTPTSGQNALDAQADIRPAFCFSCWDPM